MKGTRTKPLEALGVLLVTTIVSYITGQFFFSLVVDTFIVPFTGMRPVLAVATVVPFLIFGYKFIDSKYHFEEKGGKLFKRL